MSGITVSGPNTDVPKHARLAAKENPSKLEYVNPKGKTLFEAGSTIIRRERIEGKNVIAVYTGFFNDKPEQHKTTLYVAFPDSKSGPMYIWNGKDWQNVVVTKNDDSGYNGAVREINQLKAFCPRDVEILHRILIELKAAE